MDSDSEPLSSLVWAEDIKTYEEDLARLMAPDGPLAAAVEGYAIRPMQLEMAQAIARAIVRCDTLLAEAGTGTGKTFAYLVPALLWGGKVIISTGTRNLQDQLFLRDIPTVRQALLSPVTVALLKGRANYVCRLHLARTVEFGQLESKADVYYLREITKFVGRTETGDRSELPGVPETAAIWSRVTSTKENCPGTECPHYADCFVMKARKAAQQADVVVVNHHLFFADVALRDTGVAELLPMANTVIFDEAHQLPDTATAFFGQFVSTAQLHELCRDTRVEGLSQARDGADWVTLVAQLDKAAKDWRLTLPDGANRMALHQIAEEAAFLAAFEAVIAALAALDEALTAQAERSELLELCRARSADLLAFSRRWLALAKGEEKTDDVLWVETFGLSLQAHLTPLSIAEVFQRQRAGTPRAWIFTSATLAIRQDFHYFASRMGLLQAESKSWPSPFDYAGQAMLYVPSRMPLPFSPDYADAVVEAALPLIEAAGGGVFFLCTTLRAVGQIAERLRTVFREREWSFPLFVQGEAGKHDLLEGFRRSGRGVLVGSQSFWEGVDVRGEALSLVVVDKLPFAPPDDPVLAARIRALEKEGGNGFMDFQLPEAIISLKQGAGRLIRDERDRGVLMIADTRLVTKSYGRRIWQSLPPFARTRDEARACAFLRGDGAVETVLEPAGREAKSDKASR